MDTRHTEFKKSSEDYPSEGETRHYNSPAFFRAAKMKKSNFYMESDMLKARYLNNEITIQHLVQALNLITPPAHIKHAYTANSMPLLYDHVQSTNQSTMAVDFDKLYRALNQDMASDLPAAVCACAIDAFKSKWKLDKYSESLTTEPNHLGALLRK